MLVKLNELRNIKIFKCTVQKKSHSFRKLKGTYEYCNYIHCQGKYESQSVQDCGYRAE